MLYEVFTGGAEAIIENADIDDNTVTTGNNNNNISHRTMFTLAIATSIDAMAAGFTLNLLPLNAWLACFIIAIVTAGFSLIGVYLGKRSGTWLEDKAEMLGGLVLIIIGLKVMFFS